MDRAKLLQLSAEVLDRALLPLAQPACTLDALHLATLVFLRSRGLSAALASYTQRLAAAAVRESFALADC